MATGIIRCQEMAGTPPSVLLYTDCDCCGEKKVSSLFTAWQELHVCLDAWHFMRRFAAGCTTDSHPLYGTFMAQLSQCIFEWRGEEFNLLKRAKAAQLVKSSVQNPSDEDIMKHITKKELSLHIRHKTRRIQVTTILISNLHFMRCIAVGCTTESHPMYAIFLGRLSQCIFHWSQEDVHLLKHAKRCELTRSGVVDPSDEDAIKHISKKELTTQCCRKTRGIKDTTQLIHDLLDTFQGEQGCDTLGVPLLDADRIWDIWESQKKHITCIQDPDEVQLYTKTGVVTKGGVELPVYRCAQGLTALESFISTTTDLYQVCVL